MGGSRFLVTRKIPEKTTPRSSSGTNVWRRKWHKAKSTELTTTAAPTGMNLANDERRNPLNIASSQTGAHMETTQKYAPLVIQSPRDRLCSI